MSRLNLFLLLGLSGLLGACATGPRVSEVATEDTSRAFKTVVVDAGHGGKDNGAYRRFGGAEKIATLDVARRLGRGPRGGARILECAVCRRHRLLDALD